MAKQHLALTAAIIFGSAFMASSLSASSATFDHCPELGRTIANPDGTRDCGPGCIPESDFGFDAAMTALDGLQRHLFSEEPPADEWESSIGNATSVAVLRGTLLQLQMEIARKAGGDSYETVRRRYCDFLKDEANYLD